MVTRPFYVGNTGSIRVFFLFLFFNKSVLLQDTKEPWPTTSETLDIHKYVTERCVHETLMPLLTAIL